MTKSTPPAIAAINRATSAYLRDIAGIRRKGNATEHTYRPALKILLETHLPGWSAVNEPARQKCGAPDFAAEKNGVALGFVEAKDIGANLDNEAQSPQMERYRAALPNLILTDYVEFRHYLNGNPQPAAVAKIADADFRKTQNDANDLAKLLKAFADFGESGRGESPSAEQLAKMMAGKARLLRDLVQSAAKKDKDDDKKSELRDIFQTLENVLIRGLKLPQFADIFAQTAVYGIFAARLEAENRGVSNKQFDRAAAGKLLPQTTPFLRRFFNAFAGPDIDHRIEWMADHIAAMFSTMSLDNVARAFAAGGNQTGDPFLHFYETFLKEYDPKKRASCGVYFTPRPVVDFIVRAVDDSLKNNFAVRGGLADNRVIQCNGKETHQVQILDPAAGTGAFLARIAELVRERICQTEGEGAWPEYIRDHLLPRLNGFENMTSAYAMCHLKMALTIGKEAADELTKAAQRGDNSRRVNVFLTDALQMPDKDMGNIGALHWLWQEARAANRVKTETPVMVVVGNPPYNASSQNRGVWIAKQLERYKDGLDEKKSNLNDDYIKFIRNAEHFIEKNGRGVVAMITNNSFYDGITHRQMRRHLLGTFDQIRILNLHGDAKKKERAPDGGADQNVFNIMQGVGICIMTKTGEKAKNKNARVLYANLQGASKMKYEFLARESVDSVEWRELRPAQPHYFFTPKKFPAGKKYLSEIGVRELFRQNGSGVKTDRDSLFIDRDEKPLAEKMRMLLNGDFGGEFAALHNVADSSGYKMLDKIHAARKAGGFDAKAVRPILYRPFDEQLLYYDPNLLSRPNDDTMRHIQSGENIALLTTRLFPANHNFTHALVSRKIASANAVGGWTYIFPLWVWEGEVGKGAIRRANFRANAASAFAKRMGMAYSEDGDGKDRGIVSPESLFDYIYAVLHSPSYRADFAEFLRIDYPRIPAAADAKEFRRLAKLGGELRELHLLESPHLDDAGYPFSADGKNIVEKVEFLPDGKVGRVGRVGRVVINKAGRHFAGVPQVAWDFCVGGYYPARLWLQKRKGRSLSLADQQHYRRMLAALARTAEVIGKLDN